LKSRICLRWKFCLFKLADPSLSKTAKLVYLSPCLEG
jgi:hypothetical protein